MKLVLLRLGNSLMKYCRQAPICTSEPDEHTLEGIIDQKNATMSLVPTEYLPFSCSEPNKALINYARESLDETEETRSRGMAAVREFLRGEININFEVSENALLCYLRSRKFNIKKTCTLLRNTANFVEAHKDIFNRDSDGVFQGIFNSNVVGFLPYRDSKGRAMLYIRAERYKPESMDFDDVLFSSIVSLHIAAENPVSQIAGFVVIFDCKNLTFQHILGVSNRLIFTIQALQNCCPCLVKEFHVINAPGVFQTAWKVVRPLLSEKLRNRVIIYKKSSSLEELHRNIPPFLLPEELGGELGPYSHEHWASDVTAIKKKYHNILKKFLNRHENELQN